MAPVCIAVMYVPNPNPAMSSRAADLWRGVSVCRCNAGSLSWLHCRWGCINVHTLACVHACMRVCARVMTMNTEHGTGARDGQLEMADLEHKRSDKHRNQVHNLSLKSVVMPLKQRFSPGGCAPQPRLAWPGHPSQRNSARYETGPPDRALNLGRAVRT